MSSSKLFLDLSLLSSQDRDEIVNKYSDAVKLNITGKERSELTEARIMNYLKIQKPNTTSYDFLINDVKFELKQAEGYLKQPKFQQVKPSCYSYIICMLNYKNKSIWYLLDTNDISSKSGKTNVEQNKLPLNIQHRGNLHEGQVSPNKKFKKFAVLLGEYEPLNYVMSDLNLSDKSLNEIFGKIKKHVSK